MINNVTLVGRLTKDPELKYTPSNVAVATFTLAVNRNFKGANGEREADFINCMMWRKQAELFAEWCKKGNLVGVTGRIQTRNYENQEGRRVYLNGQDRPDYIEALNDLDGLVEVSYREAIERFLEDEVR